LEDKQVEVWRETLVREEKRTLKIFLKKFCVISIFVIFPLSYFRCLGRAFGVLPSPTSFL